MPLPSQLLRSTRETVFTSNDCDRPISKTIQWLNSSLLLQRALEPRRPGGMNRQPQLLRDLVQHKLWIVATQDRSSHVGVFANWAESAISGGLLTRYWHAWLKGTG